MFPAASRPAAVPSLPAIEAAAAIVLELDASETRQRFNEVYLVDRVKLHARGTAVATAFVESVGGPRWPLREIGFIMSALERPWLGPLSLASRELLTCLQAVPSFAVLLARGADPSRTLVYVPPKEQGEADVFVVGRMFAWDEYSPVIWIFSTIGLCLFDQPVPVGRRAFRHFELVLGTNNANKDDPFPVRLGVVLTQPPGAFPGWDWSQVSHPPLLRWLTIAGQEVARLLRSRSNLAIADTLTLGPGGQAWTRSTLTHSTILPVTAHMLAHGFAPFNDVGDSTDTVKSGEWASHPGTEIFDYGFYWLLPVSEREHERARREGSCNVFADLVDQAPKEANDDCAVAFDLLRDAP